MSFNYFMQTVAFLLKMWKIKCIFEIVPCYHDEINSGKQNVLTKIQYYDALNTLPQHSSEGCHSGLNGS